jgi:Flp pilus assembly protein CpaB
MTWLYVALAAVVVAAVLATEVWLKRVGDRAWRQRQREQRVRSIVVRIVADTAEFERRMLAAARAVDRLRLSFRMEVERKDIAHQQIDERGCE